MPSKRIGASAVYLIMKNLLSESLASTQVWCCSGDSKNLYYRYILPVWCLSGVSFLVQINSRRILNLMVWLNLYGGNKLLYKLVSVELWTRKQIHSFPTYLKKHCRCKKKKVGKWVGNRFHIICKVIQVTLKCPSGKIWHTHCTPV